MHIIVTLQAFLVTVIYVIVEGADKQPIQLFSYENVLKLADRIKIPPWPKKGTKTETRCLSNLLLHFSPKAQLCH